MIGWKHRVIILQRAKCGNEVRKCELPSASFPHSSLRTVKRLLTMYASYCHFLLPCGKIAFPDLFNLSSFF
jgi:hypothetical protein